MGNNVGPVTDSLRYEIQKELGRGGFGTAWLVKDLHNTLRKVVKQIGPFEDERNKIDAMNEAKVMSQIQHPNIVQYHGSFEKDKYLFIVMEYCEDGDLMKYLNKKTIEGNKIPEYQVIMWLKQLLEAICVLHGNNILHRDIKPGNIFVQNDQLKIGDFGISKILLETGKASTSVGTPNYMSPEVVGEQRYDERTDIWSLGCVLYEMCSLKPAFEGNFAPLADQIRSGCIPQLPDGYSPYLTHILQSMLQQDFNQRPYANQILDYLKLMQQQQMQQQQIPQLQMPQLQMPQLQMQQWQQMQPGSQYQQLGQPWNGHPY